jgi:hypothetical protein
MAHIKITAFELLNTAEEIRKLPCPINSSSCPLFWIAYFPETGYHIVCRYHQQKKFLLELRPFHLFGQARLEIAKRFCKGPDRLNDYYREILTVEELSNG